jgi:hypothetical protein
VDARNEAGHDDILQADLLPLRGPLLGFSSSFGGLLRDLVRAGLAGSALRFCALAIFGKFVSNTAMTAAMAYLVIALGNFKVR